MAIHGSLIVKGHSGYLVVPILAVPVITAAAFTYYRDHLPEFCLQNAEAVIASSALFTLALAGLALFRKARHVDLRNNELRYHSWITDKTVRLSNISAVTFEAEVSGGADQTVIEHYLSLWSKDEQLLRFNASLWPREDMRKLLHRIKELEPGVRMDRDVDRYIEYKT